VSGVALAGAAVVLAVAASCGGSTKYDGTYKGTVTSALTPAPLYGSPTYDMTLVLTEGVKGTAVQGTLDAGTTYAARQQTTNGTVNATVDNKNALNPLSVTVDQLFQDCGLNLTATGTGTIANDPQSKVLTLTWSAQGDGLCAGTQTHVSLSGSLPQVSAPAH
jgi:hypothetical protein